MLSALQLKRTTCSEAAYLTANPCPHLGGACGVRRDVRFQRRPVPWPVFSVVTNAPVLQASRRGPGERAGPSWTGSLASWYVARELWPLPPLVGPVWWCLGPRCRLLSWFRPEKVHLTRRCSNSSARTASKLCTQPLQVPYRLWPGGVEVGGRASGGRAREKVGS